MTDILWQTKLHARLHDPAEKALVLLRDPAGHEGGTSRALHRALGFDRIPAEGDSQSSVDPDNPGVLDTVLFDTGIPASIHRHVQRADWWASAADRPQWPMEAISVRTRRGDVRTLKVADWAQVRWTKRPVLVHPLSGGKLDLRSLGDTDIHDIKERSRTHFERLSLQDPKGGGTDWYRTLLAYWRFGPELQEDEDDGKLGLLWPLLPADTRVPDHSIWDHLDLTSAFAGAFAADDDAEAALLALSLGPVQPFIAAARSTSDLWAGSHLLARLSWEAMKVVCERLGPDAILFPRLRGVPQVDVWLRDECGLPHEWFAGCDWTKGATDSNPLFGAALPNRFVAVVPSSQARKLADEITDQVGRWLQSLGADVVDRLLEGAGFRAPGQPRDETVHAYRQMREQLRGFPEVHWAIVPFSLIQTRDRQRQRDLDTTVLSDAMAPFFGAESGGDCGFLASQAWQVLRQDVRWSDNTTFWSPNPGTLYPAVYDLAERVLAAAKAVRPFEQTEQRGWRCSLTGETEWLTTDPDQLATSYRRQEHTLWARVSARRPAWAKSGEHLGALPAVKRLWPTLFAEEVAAALGPDQQSANRFVISTHTMALAHQLDGWLDTGREPGEELRSRLAGVDSVALPRRLLRRDRPSLHWAKKIPALLDAVREGDDEAERRHVEKLIRNELRGDGDSSDHGDSGTRLETYYALLMLDGDRMGRILSGDANAIPYRKSFHPQVRDGFDRRSEGNAAVRQYGEQGRAISPNRHLAVSGALNDFALHIVPEVVEREHLGRIIYAGGDDVLAILPAADLLPAMQRLRNAYSGDAHENQGTDWQSARRGGRLVCNDGFALLNNRLMRMMAGATASCGAVIAHYQTPLAAVLRELRAAEQRAKNEGDRDAFSITVLKRSGGDLRLTAKWGEPIDLLAKLRGFLAESAVSRRAVYHSLLWLRDLPEDTKPDMLGSLLSYQLTRQTGSKTVLDYHDVPGLAKCLVELATRQEQPRPWLTSFFSMAEFLAREARMPNPSATANPPATEE